jgi:hypothetical protein
MDQNTINLFIQMGVVFFGVILGMIVQFFVSHFNMKKKVELNEQIDKLSMTNLNQRVERLEEEVDEKYKNAINYVKDTFDTYVKNTVSLALAEFKNKIDSILTEYIKKEDHRTTEEDVRDLYRKTDKQQERISEAHSNIQLNQNQCQEVARRVTSLENESTKK